jgi:hypothetical protein
MMGVVAAKKGEAGSDAACRPPKGRRIPGEAEKPVFRGLLTNDGSVPNDVSMPVGIARRGSGIARTALGGVAPPPVSLQQDIGVRDAGEAGWQSPATGEVALLGQRLAGVTVLIEGLEKGPLLDPTETWSRASCRTGAHGHSVLRQAVVAASLGVTKPSWDGELVGEGHSEAGSSEPPEVGDGADSVNTAPRCGA